MASADLRADGGTHPFGGGALAADVLFGASLGQPHLAAHSFDLFSRVSTCVPRQVREDLEQVAAERCLAPYHGHSVYPVAQASVPQVHDRVHLMPPLLLESPSRMLGLDRTATAGAIR